MGGGPRWDRRRLLRTGAAAVGGAGAGWSVSAVVADRAAAAAPDATQTLSIAPTAGTETAVDAGRHQAGVDTPPQAHLALVGWNLTGGPTRSGLSRMMRLLTDDARRLAGGEGALADTEPELAAYPSRLTVTFGFGPRVVERLVRRPERLGLEALPEFAGDRLEDAWAQTDVVAQVCCDDPTTLAHARRMLLKDAAAFAVPAWIQEGFRTARGTAPAGTTMRNLMGQVDGTVNLDPAEPVFDKRVWAAGDPRFDGGTFLVVRRFRMDMAGWDRVDRTGREATIGRRLDNGAPLTGANEFDEPDFEATDRFGFPVIDPASHIARARHRTPEEQFLRRAYNYNVADPSKPGATTPAWSSSRSPRTSPGPSSRSSAGSPRPTGSTSGRPRSAPPSTRFRPPRPKMGTSASSCWSPAPTRRTRHDRPTRTGTTTPAAPRRPLRPPTGGNGRSDRRARGGGVAARRRLVRPGLGARQPGLLRPRRRRPAGRGARADLPHLQRVDE
nr:Dyp-type peroxidase [Nocardioides sambongensis]